MNNKEFEQFENEMLSNGNIYWIKDPLNQKQSVTSNVYIEKYTGLELFADYRDLAISILSEMGINNTNEQAAFIKMFSTRHIVPQANVEAEYLIATPKGNVIDLKKLQKIYADNRDPNLTIGEWIFTSRVFQENYITMRTNVNYPKDGDWKAGRYVLEKFLRV